MTRDDVIKVLLVGLSAGGTASGFVLLMNSGFESEDVFAFTGAIIGAAATVAGAAWLADRSQSAAVRAEQALLLTECERLLAKTNRTLATAVGIAHSGDLYTGTPAFRAELHDVARDAVDTRAILAEALSQGRTLDFRQRVKVIKAEASIQSFRHLYDDVFSELEIDPMDERTWSWALEYMETCLRELVGALRK